MKRALGLALGIAMLAFAPTGCKGGEGLAAGHGGSTGTITAGQTASGLGDGSTDGTQPQAGETAVSAGASGQTTRSGGAGSMASSAGGVSSGGGKTDGSAFVGGSSAGIGITASSYAGGSTSAGGSTTKTGGSQTSSGTSSAGGTAGTGGTLATGGGTGSNPACGPHESGWSDSSGTRCVAVSVSVPGFAVDATEVTRRQYAAWLATHPANTGQPEACAWNTSFTPDATCMADSSVCHGDACEDHPQPCADMCDAAAYCKAIGRSLCTGPNWLKACSSDGAYQACYATGFVRNTCNDYTVFGSTTVPVASKTGCQAPASSPYTGIYDMIGNLEEWVENCRTSNGADDSCSPIGLPFGMGAPAPFCSQYTYAKRSEASPTIGFRCCTP